jgi:hypothetical protein
MNKYLLLMKFCQSGNETFKLCLFTAFFIGYNQCNRYRAVALSVTRLKAQPDLHHNKETTNCNLHLFIYFPAILMTSINKYTLLQLILAVQNKQPSFKSGIEGKLHFRTLNYSRYNVHCVYNRSLHTSSPFFSLLHNEPATILICQFVPMSIKSTRSMYGVIFVRNGTKAYVKNPQVFLREKSAKLGFMKSSIITPAQRTGRTN